MAYTPVDISGSHALSCRRNPGRAYVIILWTIGSGVQYRRLDCLPPRNRKVFSDKTESARRDWRTHTHTVARRALCHLHGTSLWMTPSLFHIWAEARRVLAQQQKQRPHAYTGEILWHFQELPFFTSDIRNFRPINQACCDFLSTLGHRLFLVLDDPRETSFPFQRLSVAIQRFNSVCFCHSLGSLPAQFFDQLRHKWSFTICIFFAFRN